MFGENEYDRRDYGFAFAALQVSMHMLKVMAERGLITPGEVFRIREDAMPGFDIIPESILHAQGRQAIDKSFEQIFSIAAEHVDRKTNG